MSRAKPRILLVEDTPSLARVYEGYLSKNNYEIDTVDTVAACLSALDRQPPELMLLDLELPDGSGMEVLEHVAARSMRLVTVVITAHGSINTAVAAMQGGAFDFIVKPFSADRLLVTVRNALEHQRLSETVEILKQEFDRGRYCGFIGSSLSMQAVYRIIDNAASSKAAVMVTGESGTGKELCAEAIHQQSARRDRPFVALNCGAIPRDLVESEVFGHVKGAFTGAIADRPGAASQAAGGTLFLDEIGEMDMSLQSKLLRFLQTGEFQRVGGTRIETADVRIVSATNRDPLDENRAGRFREDLYYRLHVIPIELPPLRDRDDDIIEIARSFLETFCAEEGKSFSGFADDVEVLLRAYDWPGNVRQLQNVVRNIVVLNEGEQVKLSMVPMPLSSGGSAVVSSARSRQSSVISGGEELETPIRPLHEIERAVIEDAIRKCDGNIPRAAGLLEVNPSTIYRKRKAWKA